MRSKEPPRLSAHGHIESALPFRLILQRIDRHYELHWHEFYELTYIRSGRGVNVVNGQACPLRPGSLYLLTPADFHEIEPAPGECMDIYNFIFAEDLLSDELRELLFHEVRELSAAAAAERRPALEAEFRLIGREAGSGETGSLLLVRGALERILIELVRLSGAEPPARTAANRHEGLQRTLMHLRHRFREPMTLESAARLANLSPQYFSECFRRLTGIPFQRYLQDLRLDFARSLLAASDISVTEACHVSGFHTLTHFERAFKRKFGFTPRAARRK